MIFLTGTLFVAGFVSIFLCEHWFEYAHPRRWLAWLLFAGTLLAGLAYMAQTS